MSTTFTFSTPGAYDPETDTHTTPTTTTITGSAIQVRGDPEVYKREGLIESEAPTILWVPTTYGQAPEPGYTVTWSNTEYTARNVRTIQPDGVPIMSYVVIAR